MNLTPEEQIELDRRIQELWANDPARGLEEETADLIAARELKAMPPLTLEEVFKIQLRLKNGV